MLVFLLIAGDALTTITILRIKKINLNFVGLKLEIFKFDFSNENIQYWVDG